MALDPNKPTMSKEEQQSATRKTFGDNKLLETGAETFDLDSCKSGVVETRNGPAFRVSIRMSVAAGSNGPNKPGDRYEEVRFFSLTDDGKIDDEAENFGRNYGAIKRMAYAFFGGKHEREPGRFPSGSGGESFTPWYALEHYPADCGQISGELTQYTTGGGETRNGMRSITSA